MKSTARLEWFLGSALLLLVAQIGVQASCSRSPLAIVRRESGLRVPSNARVLEFRDESSGAFGQDLYTRVVLQLDTADVAALMSQARRAGYLAVGDAASPVSIADLRNDFGISERGAAEARAELTTGSTGLYQLRRDTPSSYVLSVLDQSRGRVVIVMLIL